MGSLDKISRLISLSGPPRCANVHNLVDCAGRTIAWTSFRSLAQSQTRVDRAPITTWATLTPAELVRSVWSHLPSVVTTTVIVTVTVAALLMAWPNRYSSNGLMYVRLGRGAISVDPTSKASTSVSLQETRSAEVISVREMLVSREICRRIVERVGAEEINRPRTWIDRSLKSVSATLASLMPKRTPSFGDMSAEEYNAQIASEEAIKRVQQSIAVAVTKNAYTISIACKSDDPLLAQQIVSAMMDEYGKFHVEAHRATGSLSFFEQEVATSRQLAVEAREALQAAKSRLGWSSEQAGEAMLLERITKLEIALDEAQSSLAERSSRANSLEQRMAGVEHWIPTEVTRGVANHANDEMRSQLYGLEVKENDALARLKPNHPRYQMLKEMVAQSKQIVSDEEADKELSVEAVNPVRQDMEKNYEVALADTAGLISRVQSLTSALEEAKEDLTRLNQDSLELARLTWASNLAEQNFLAHSKSLEEARMLDQLDSSNLSDVSIVQEASLQLKKTGPMRGLLSVLGCMLGLSLGVLQALVRTTPSSTSSSASAPTRRPTPAREEYEQVRSTAHGASTVGNTPVGLPR